MSRKDDDLCTIDVLGCRERVWVGASNWVLQTRYRPGAMYDYKFMIHFLDCSTYLYRHHLYPM